VILQALAQHRVRALFVYPDLRSAPPHRLALALLKAEEAIEAMASRSHPTPHRLLQTGRNQAARFEAARFEAAGSVMPSAGGCHPTSARRRPFSASSRRIA
jgi:hypothetical protein